MKPDNTDIQAFIDLCLKHFGTAPAKDEAEQAATALARLVAMAQHTEADHKANSET